MKIYEQELKETLFYYDLVEQKAELILALYRGDKWTGRETIYKISRNTDKSLFIFYDRNYPYGGIESMSSLASFSCPVEWFALEGAELVRAIKEYKEKEGI